MIKFALEYMVDNTRTVYLDYEYEKITTKKEPGCSSVQVSKELYDALVLVEEAYERLLNEANT